MKQTTNLIFSFIGGAAVGALIAYTIMRKNVLQVSNNVTLNEDAAEMEDSVPKSDKPSFISPKVLDTHKISYDGIVKKPELEEVSKKYQDPSFDKMNAEREHPEDDAIDEEDEYEDDEAYAEADALMNHAGQMEIEETDGFGHVICELTSSHRDSVIYLIPEEYAGEIYPLEDLTYYAKDNVVCDVTDAPVDNVDKLLGDALDHFGECGEDGEDKVYVRNASIGFEYEITRVDKYYAAHIYGVTDEDLKPDTPKPNRKTRGISKVSTDAK